MIRQFAFSLILLWLICTLFMCCNKENGPILDQEAPQIRILSPKTNTSYTAGSVLQLSVEVTENLELHQYQVILKHVASNTQITVEAGHTHEKFLMIEKQMTLPNLGSGIMELIVEADDHDGNSGQAMIQLTID